MVAVFTEKEKEQAFKTKKILLICWLACIGLALIAVLAMVFINLADVNNTGSRELKMPFMIATMVVIIMAGGGSLFFYDLKFRPVSRYCSMLKSIKTGIKDKTSGTFIEIDPSIKEKDGVYFYSLVLDCEPMKRDDITERKILVEKSHALPKFEKGDKIKFITHANILVAYEPCMDNVFDKLNASKKTNEGERL